MKRIIVFVVAFALLASVGSVIAEPKKPVSNLESTKSTDVTGSVNKIETDTYENNVNIDDNDTGQGTTEKLLPADYTVINPPEPRKIVYVKSNFNTVISGNVRLPEEKVAPKGGLKVIIQAGINPNTMSYEVLRSDWPIAINEVSITIPEGENSASYEIPVVNYYKMDDKEFKPWYALSFSFIYMNKGKTDGQFGFYKGPLDAAKGNMPNIDYTFEKYDASLFK